MTVEYTEHINNGTAFMAVSNYEAAVTEFETAIKIMPNESDGYINLGHALASMEKYEEAMKSFKTANMYSPDNGKILFSMGGLSFLMGNKRDAVQYYNRCEAAGYRTEALYMILAGLFAESNDYIMAIRNVAKAIDINPLKGDLYAKKASMELAIGLFDEAMETMNELKSLIPDAREPYDLGSKILCTQKKYKEALLLADEGVLRFPDDPQLLLVKVRVMIESGDFAAAEPFVLRALSMNVSSEQLKQAVLFQIAIYSNTNRNEDCLSTLEGFISDHADSEMMLLLMNLYVMGKKYNDVYRISEKVMECAENDEYVATAKFYHADALKHMNRLKEAKIEYRRLTSELRKVTLATPSATEIYVFRLLSHVELEEYDKALELGDFLVNAYPENANGHTYKSFVYQRMGNTNMAEKEKQAALQIDSKLQFVN